MRSTDLNRDVRILKLYAVVSSVLLAILTLGAFRSRQLPTRITELDVERINLRESDGKLDLVMANKARFPAPVIGGKTAHRSGDVWPGIIFYNDEGDEDGGLTFGSARNGGNVSAGGEFLFDQYHQDQTVGITYQETNGRRTAGFRVWDRSERALATYLDSLMALRTMPAGAAKTALTASFHDRGMLGTERVFVGKRPDRSSTVVLYDAQGRARLLLTVDSTGAPSIELRDAGGSVVRKIS